MHQLQALKTAMRAISKSIEYGVMTSTDIQSMFVTQNISKVINTITEMMGLGYIDISDLVIGDKLAIIPHHMIVHHLSTPNSTFAQFVNLWEKDIKNTGIIRDILLASFRNGGYTQLSMDQFILLLSAKSSCPGAMIEDYLFDLASQQNNADAMKMFNNYIHARCSACGSFNVTLKCRNCSFSYYCDRQCQLRDWNREDRNQPNHQIMCPVVQKVYEMFQKIKQTVSSVIAHIVRDFILWEYRNDEWCGDVVDAVHEIIMKAEMDKMKESLGALMGTGYLLYNAKSIRGAINKVAVTIGVDIVFESPSIQRIHVNSKSFAAFLDNVLIQEDLELIEEVFYVAKQENIWWGRWKKLLMQNNTDEEYMDIVCKLAIRVGINVGTIDQSPHQAVNDTVSGIV